MSDKRYEIGYSDVRRNDIKIDKPTSIRPALWHYPIIIIVELAPVIIYVGAIVLALRIDGIL